MDKITVMHNGKTFTVLKNDVSKKIWQELKDNRPLTTEEYLENVSTKYTNLEDKESTYLLGFICVFGVAAIICYSVCLIYVILNL
jgi:hypothetical protein